jgi:hypothetical protein
MAGGTTAVLLSLLAAFNVAVDPRADFGTGLVRNFSVPHRSRRVAMLRELRPPPRLLVLGSSRSWKVEPDYLEERTGLPAFVAAVDDARAEDHLALLRYCLEDLRLPLEVVVLQLDVPAFHENMPASSHLVLEPALRRHLPDDLPMEEYARPYLNTLSHGQLVESIRTLRTLWQPGGAPPDDVEIQPDGTIRYRDREAAIAAGSFDLGHHVRGTVEHFLRVYQGFRRLSPRRLANLDVLLTLARERGVKVLAYLPPLHPIQDAVLRQGTAYPRLLPSLRREAATRVRAAGGRFLDASDLASFGGDPELFYDGIHPREENNRRLLEVLLALQ